MQRSRGLLMGVRLAGSPPTGSVLNGPGRRNLALRNGGQFSWSTRRRGAKAVCESPCSLLLLRGGIHPFPSAPERWGGGSSFQPRHRSCSLSPYALRGRTWMTQPPLRLQWHGLFSAHPVETWEAWAAPLPPMTSTALTLLQRQGEAMQLCLRCPGHATLPGAEAVHDAARLLRWNVMLQFNSLSSECSLSGDG